MTWRIAAGVCVVLALGLGAYFLAFNSSDDLGGSTGDTIAKWIEEEGCSPDRSAEEDGYSQRILDNADEIVHIRCGGEIPPGSTLFRFASTRALERAFPPVKRARHGDRICVLDREVFTMSGFDRSANACRELEGQFVCPPACRKRGF